MTRKPRKRSNSGIYHVMIRGIGKQVLFEDDRDRLYFLKILKRYKSEESLLIYAYCLMENHVHLLLKTEGIIPELFMKKVEGSYAFYYNHKYERVGTLFQERYKSETVEDEAYFFVALRYIIQNPEKANIAPASRYKWSSYEDYVDDSGFTDTQYAINLFGRRDELLKYVSQENDDICLELREPAPGESRAKQIIQAQLGTDSGTVLQKMGKKERDEALRKLKQNGLSVRQIERLTGISRGVVQKA